MGLISYHGELLMFSKISTKYGKLFCVKNVDNYPFSSTKSKRVSYNGVLRQRTLLSSVLNLYSSSNKQGKQFIYFGL